MKLDELHDRINQDIQRLNQSMQTNNQSLQSTLKSFQQTFAETMKNMISEMNRQQELIREIHKESFSALEAQLVAIHYQNQVLKQGPQNVEDDLVGQGSGNQPFTHREEGGNSDHPSRSNNSSRSIRMDFPRFNGEGFDTWWIKCEHYFELESIKEDAKVRLVAIHLEDQALSWYKGYCQARKGLEPPSWEEFFVGLQQRFGAGLYDDPLEDLLDLKQTKSVQEYQAQFEVKLSRVEVTQRYAITIFLKGLKPEIAVGVKMFSPDTLARAFALAKMQEVANKLQLQELIRCISTPLLPNPKWKPQPALGAQNTLVKSAHIPKPAAAKSLQTFVKPKINFDEKRAKGVCFWCDEKCTSEHKCNKRKQVYLMEMDDTATEEEEAVSPDIVGIVAEQELVEDSSTLELTPVVDGSPEETADEVHALPSDDDADHEDHDHDYDQDPTAEINALTENDIKQKIIKQVEYYFSDENLPTDKYMMSLIKKNKEGFVPISLIASFRKMKKLKRDHSFVVAALRESSFLVVSLDGKKVKRLHPFQFAEVKDPKLCTVVVENLPEDHSVENIKKIFGEVGKIRNISICDPRAVGDSMKGKKLDILISSKLHALVEYETVEAAEKAAAMLNNEGDWRSGMHVKLLKRMGKNGTRRQARRDADSEKNGITGNASNYAGDEENHNSSELQDGAPDEEDEEHISKEKNEQRSRNRGRPRRNKYRANNGLGHGSTYSAHAIEPSKPPPGPKMPDGTRGFTMGRGRPLVPNPSQQVI